MNKSRRVKITELNPHITCVLCSGYLIDATTIIECLHSFCRTCIVKYLESNKYCPICDVQVHKTKPLLNIRSDQTLQDIVYKLVPGLFQNEMYRRRDYYVNRPDQKPSNPEQRGEVSQMSHIYTPDECISLCLEYYNNNISKEIDNNKTTDLKLQAHSSRRYLRCPAAVSVVHLQKLIRAKFGLSVEHRVDILYQDEKLNDDFTLMDVAYIYLWRRKGPLHLTYRIFEVAKRIKLNDIVSGKCEIKEEKLQKDNEAVNNEWKEVQLQISENGVMSVTNINEDKNSETVKSNVIELKNELEIAEVSSNKKSDKVTDKEVSKEVELSVDKTETKLGKHKLHNSVSDVNETSAKVMKPNIPKESSKSLTPPLKNVQQLSRNHPLKIYSQSVTKANNNVLPVSNLATKIIQTKSQNNSSSVSVNKIEKPANNNNNAAKVTISTSTSSLENHDKTTSVENSSSADSGKTSQSIQSSVSVNSTSTNASTSTMTSSNAKYTQAGQNVENTKTTVSDEQKTPISSACHVMSANNCIQSSKVSIVPKRSPVKVGAYKTLQQPPKAWNPQLPRQSLKKSAFATNNGASTSDLRTENKTPSKPPKFFKLRSNVPRYLGNPASGVKPMYQVREGDKSPPEVKKLPEIKKAPPDNNVKLNNKDDKANKSLNVDVKAPMEVKKQCIIKIDPKTLRPIIDKVSEAPSCSETSEMKINQSTVPIFTPLRTQKSQTSPKIDRKSPKTNYLDIQNAQKNSAEVHSPKGNSGKQLNSPTSKKDKLSLSFTPPNPFIPNLTSQNLPPNQFLYSGFASYDPRVMNNLSVYNPFSMYYPQSRLNFSNLSTQNLSPSMLSNLNMELSKNLRKNYDLSILQQVSPTMEVKKPVTPTKNSNENCTDEKISSNGDKSPDSKLAIKNVNKNEKIEKKTSPVAEPKKDNNNSSSTTIKEKQEKSTEEINNKTEDKEIEINSNNFTAKTDTVDKEKEESKEKQQKEAIQDVDKETPNDKEIKEKEEDKSKEIVQNSDTKINENNSNSTEEIKTS